MDVWYLPDRCTRVVLYEVRKQLTEEDNTCLYMQHFSLGPGYDAQKDIYFICCLFSVGFFLARGTLSIVQEPRKVAVWNLHSIFLLREGCCIMDVISGPSRVCRLLEIGKVGQFVVGCQIYSQKEKKIEVCWMH